MRLRILAMALALCLCLGACAMVSTSKSDSTVPANGISISSEQVSMDSDTIDTAESYLRLMESLLGTSWDTPSDIPIYKLVHWYAYQFDEAERQKYVIDGKDGLYFPENEFEEKMAKYFGLSSDYLRSSSECYSEEEHTYRTISALGPLSEKVYEIIDISDNNSITSIEFKIHYIEIDEVAENILNLTYTDDGVQFLSYSYNCK